MVLTKATAPSQIILRIPFISSVPVVNPREIYTACVSGNNIYEIFWMRRGTLERGKKVPLNKNIGVMNKKVG